MLCLLLRVLLPCLQVALPEDPTGAQRFTKRDASLALRNSEAGVVDQVLLTTNEGGQAFVKVRVRSICIPQVGVQAVQCCVAPLVLALCVCAVHMWCGVACRKA
jgi:hypothetical protein